MGREIARGKNEKINKIKHEVRAERGGRGGITGGSQQGTGGGGVTGGRQRGKGRGRGYRREEKGKGGE